MPTRRTKSVGTKVTDGEYAMLESLAGERPMSEWVRQVLLSVVTRHPVEEVLVAELLALRTILLNLHFALANGQTPAVDAMQRLIERADQEKMRKAKERFSSR